MTPRSEAAIAPAAARGSGQGAARVVVASVPASHVYVHHLSSEDGSGPLRLDDPDPDDASRAATQRWWPPVMLDPAWIETHAFDVMHVHFGFDALAPERLREVTAALRRTGRPLVYTAHDLRNPHHVDRTLHDRQLDVMVPEADALITLTRGAADEIRRRWGREAAVLPHPHVVPFDVMESHADAAARQGPFRVGLHLKSLRASMSGAPMVRALDDVVAGLDDAVLRVDVHHDVMDPRGAHHDPELVDLLSSLRRAGRIELEVHDYLTDDELWAYLAGLDVSVLPYRFGTHSGWLEACHDLGTAVVAPTCGYYADQGDVHSYRHDEAGFDVASLARAVRSARTAGPTSALTVAERRRQRRAVARAHDAVYSDVIAGRRW